MAAQYNFKPEFLENTIKSLQCFKCKDVPGFDKEQRNRYSCHDNAHQLCEKCKNGPCECGSTVGKIPNPVVHEILKDMPMFCPHYKRGCRQVSAQAEDLKVRKIQKLIFSMNKDFPLGQKLALFRSFFAFEFF